MARNTAIFSIATGISRVAGLAREIVAASFFGTSGPASAFTLAFQIPNLVANLFANAALSAAFVPVFTDLLQRGRRKEALRLASTLFWIMLIVLGSVTAVFILAAYTIMPLFTGSTFNHQLDMLTRAFFAVRRPWIPTRLAALNIVVDVIVSIGLYQPFGISGLIIGTVAANALMTALQLHRLRIGFNGRLTAKKARVSSRFKPAKGRLKANQNSAIDTRCVEWGPNWPRWNTSRTIGVGSTIMNTAAGISSRLIWRMPMPTARRIAPTSRREAIRLSVGKSTVATATLKIPCGSM